MILTTLLPAGLTYEDIIGKPVHFSNETIGEIIDYSPDTGNATVRIEDKEEIARLLTGKKTKKTRN